MGWDLLRLEGTMHFFRKLKELGYKESLCGLARAPITRDIPGMLETSEDMCKTCFKLAPKRRWGDGFIS